MKKLLILIVLFVIGCTTGPNRQNYQTMMNEEIVSPFFHIPPLNQKDFDERTWILLAESKSKNWFYDPYSLSEDDDIVSFDAFIAPREKNNLPLYNPTIVGPYRQKLDCFSNHQWSETLYTQNLVVQRPLLGDIKPINGSGWVKIKPKTAMAYIRSRVCGRKFIDDQNVNYFLFQEGALPVPAPLAKKVLVEVWNEKENQQNMLAKEEVLIDPLNEKPPIFYEVINNEILITDAKKNIRQMRLSSYWLNKDFSKQADFIFTAHCQENTYTLIAQGSGQQSSGSIGAKNSLPAVAFNRACGDHGAYMRTISRGAK